MATAKKRKRSDCDDTAADDQGQHSSKRPKSVRTPRTKRTATSKPAGDDLFRKLPGELRNKIYDLALLEEGHHVPIAVHFGSWRSWLYHRGPEATPRWREPGLLRASKWIRNEAKAIYYQGNHFEIKISTSQVQAACDWIRSTVEGCASEDRHFNLSNLHCTKSNWADIHTWLHLARLVRDIDIGFIECNEEYDSCNIGSALSAGIGRAFYEIAMLGSRAATEGWDEQTLEVEFEEWVDMMMMDRLSFYKARSSTSLRIDCNIGKVRRRMRKIEHGSHGGRQRREGAGPFSGPLTKHIPEMKMQLRSSVS
ncbi:hypothetical protein LTR85_011872 [Meristemomyces frigidus]|nr:hypothetical protein LTR85_011872 [Meristemomyces frigidus]